MKKLTQKDFSHACYDPYTGESRAETRSEPMKVFDEGWTGNALDVLKLDISARDRITVVLLADPPWLNKSEQEKIRKAFLKRLPLGDYEDRSLMTLASKLHRTMFEYDNVANLMIEVLS